MSNQEPGLVGTIPEQLAELTSLTHLDLSENQLYLSIPSSLSNLEDLKLLDLSNNGFSDSIPSELGRLKGMHALLFPIELC